MTDDPIPTPPFPALEPAEAALCEALRTLGAGDRHAISVKAASAGRRITGAFLRWFLVEAIPQRRTAIVAVDLEGFLICGKLDLSATRLDVVPTFLNCEFDDLIQLTEAKVITLRIIGGKVEHIRADRLTAEGQVEIRAGGENRIDPIEFRGQLRLNGAKIRGNLNLGGCQFTAAALAADEPTLFADGITVDGNVFLWGGFSIRGEARLNGGDIGRNLDCSGATFAHPSGYAISAAGAHISGSVYLCETQRWTRGLPGKRPFSSTGVVRLEGTKIDGDLNCEGGSFVSAEFQSAPVSRLDDPVDELFYSIKANGVDVSGDILLTTVVVGDDTPPEYRFAFVSRGCIALMSARVGGDLVCDNSTLSFPGEVPLCADSIVVNGATFLSDVATDGVLRLVQADLKQGFYVEDTTFEKVDARKPDGPPPPFDAKKKVFRNLLKESESPISVIEDLEGPACGIFAPQAVVGGTFIWRRIRKERAASVSSADTPVTRFCLQLLDARANSIQDDEASWQKVEFCDVNGTSYESIFGLSDDATAWRLRELDRHYAILNGARRRDNVALAFRALRRAFFRTPEQPQPFGDEVLDAATKSFKPQPYVQLAEIFRHAGFENAAATVLVRLERNRTRYSDFSWFRQCARWMLDGFLRYGYSPFRPLLIVIFWAALSAVVFHHARDAKEFEFVRASPPAAQSPTANATPQYPAFNAVVYAIDTLVPIVDFNQKKSWILRDPPFCSVASTLLFFNTFFGWLMTTLFAAGVTGLTRTH